MAARPWDAEHAVETGRGTAPWSFYGTLEDGALAAR